jgi:hypothetical protein
LLGGAFQTSRDIFNHEIWQDVIKFRLFFFIVGNAVFSQEGLKIGSVLVKRGQYLRSFRNLAEDLKYIDNRQVKEYSVSVISKKINQLVKEERLEIETTELGTLFTVVNYDRYQVLDNYMTEPRTVREQSENNNKKDKNVKNIYSSEFDQFWSLYPTKQGKKKAAELFNKVRKKHEFETIMDGLKNYMAYVESVDWDMSYKNPATFLNQESFLDEYKPMKQKKVAQYPGLTPNEIRQMNEKSENTQIHLSVDDIERRKQKVREVSLGGIF